MGYESRVSKNRVCDNCNEKIKGDSKSIEDHYKDCVKVKIIYLNGYR